MTIRWRAALAVGHPEIDRQHEELFARAQVLVEALAGDLVEGGEGQGPKQGHHQGGQDHRHHSFYLNVFFFSLQHYKFFPRPYAVLREWAVPTREKKKERSRLSEPRSGSVLTDDYRLREPPKSRPPP